MYLLDVEELFLFVCCCFSCFFFKSRCSLVCAKFLFQDSSLSPFQLQLMLSPVAHERCTVYSSSGKDENNCLFLVVTFFFNNLSLSHNKSERLERSVRRGHGALYHFARRCEVVF